MIIFCLFKGKKLKIDRQYHLIIMRWEWNNDVVSRISHISYACIIKLLCITRSRLMYNYGLFFICWFHLLISQWLSNITSNSAPVAKPICPSKKNIERLLVGKLLLKLQSLWKFCVSDPCVVCVCVCNITLLRIPTIKFHSIGWGGKKILMF